MRDLHYSLSLSLTARGEFIDKFHKKTSFNGYNIVIKSYLSRDVARRGARLCEEQREERNTNGEGVASGGATQIGICYHLCLFLHYD